MDKVIEWCNINSGFAQIVLSFVAVLTSVIAVVVSIKNSRYPYKKKIILSFGSYIGVGFIDDGLHVTATNASFRSLQVKKLGLLLFNNDYIINMNTIGVSQVKLETGQETTQYFSSDELRKALSGYNSKDKVYAFFEDSEGYKKKKYICKVGNISQRNNN